MRNGPAAWGRPVRRMRSVWPELASDLRLRQRWRRRSRPPLSRRMCIVHTCHQEPRRRLRSILPSYWRYLHENSQCTPLGCLIDDVQSSVVANVMTLRNFSIASSSLPSILLYMAAASAWIFSTSRGSDSVFDSINRCVRAINTNESTSGSSTTYMPHLGCFGGHPS